MPQTSVSEDSFSPKKDHNSCIVAMYNVDNPILYNHGIVHVRAFIKIHFIISLLCAEIIRKLRSMRNVAIKIR